MTVKRGRSANARARLFTAGIAPAGLGKGFATGRENHRLLQGLRVLVVDDDADMRELATVILRIEGAQVRTASSGSEALQLLTHEVRLAIDVLVCDLAMPGYDGIAVVRKLRECEQAAHRRRLPAVAVTAHVLPAARRAALDAGFTAFVSKPVSPWELTRTIRAQAGRRAAAVNGMCATP